MFIRLTTDDNNIIFLNVNEIKNFYRKDFNGTGFTVLNLQYGTMLVKETTEEIYAMTERK